MRITNILPSQLKGQPLLASRREHERRRRLQKRLRQETARKRDPTDPVVGWFAQRGIDAVCDGDGLIIAGSRDMMISILQKHAVDPDDYHIQQTTASHILAGITAGGAYCFDEQAYGRFLAPAQAAGLPLEQEDFSDPGPLGIHLVRVGYVW